MIGATLRRLVSKLSSSSQPATQPHELEAKIGSAAYWQVLAEYAWRQHERFDARQARLEVSAGVLLAAAGAMVAARLQMRESAWIPDVSLILGIGLVFLACSIVLWPRQRGTVRPEALRASLEPQLGRNDAAMHATLYRNLDAANEATVLRFDRVFKLFRVAIAGFILAGLGLLAPLAADVTMEVAGLWVETTTVTTKSLP